MYRAAPLPSLLLEPLDDLTAVFYRASGITHLLASPAPEILQTLQTPMTRADLLAKLADRFDLAEADGDALDARLEELVAAGLAWRA
jgi:PqqD family protein of HPr-rel-A system